MNMILFPEGKPTRRETFDEYYSSGGYEALRKNLSSEAILNEVTSSGLRGRGGAGFPVGRKWSVARETPNQPRDFGCNAGEDEAGRLKDRTLIEYRPHLVLDGTVRAAVASGSGTA